MLDDKTNLKNNSLPPSIPISCSFHYISWFDMLPGIQQRNTSPFNISFPLKIPYLDTHLVRGIHHHTNQYFQCTVKLSSSDILPNYSIQVVRN